ncbi:hypothetical protein AAKU55_002919 [Oxalobacteraceae bacterium GrIS 1.11]
MRYAVVLLLLCCSSVYAALGGPPSVFTAANTGVKARILAADTANYHLSETTLPNGTVVREYVSRAGIVFAVSWQGPFLPDLRTLLGPHFDTMSGAAAKQTKAGHSQLHIERPEVTIVSGGHMRAYTGRAWVSAEFPPGFSADAIH